MCVSTLSPCVFYTCPCMPQHLCIHGAWPSSFGTQTEEPMLKARTFTSPLLVIACVNVLKQLRMVTSVTTFQE